MEGHLEVDSDEAPYEDRTMDDGLQSLRDSVRQSIIENGRGYHAYNPGTYAFPNDSPEVERLEWQHEMWRMTLGGLPGLCPKALDGASRVLDVGAGTGHWAIDYADIFPDSEVIGIDLSAIQPTSVPPNVYFYVDDAEGQEWEWRGITTFDFIFMRAMCGCFANVETIFRKAFDALEPGGWMEAHELGFPFASDDGTLDMTSDLGQYTLLAMDASQRLGRPLDVAPLYRPLMERVGFVNVTERRFRWPIGPWPRDALMKELGWAMLHNVASNIEGLVMALFTRALDWTVPQTAVYCASVRKQIRDPAIHSYMNVFVVYGQKPLA